MHEPKRLDTRAYDAIKGVLIFIVILDHNDILRSLRPVQELFLPITFHVGGFLLLPFLGAAHVLSRRMVAERAMRYLVPFGCAVLGYALLYQLLIPSGLGAPARLADLAVALAFGTAVTLKPATGFVVLWFLPTLFSLVLLAAAVHSAPKRWFWPILAGAWALHLVLGLLPPRLSGWVPFDLPIALYMLPLGLLLAGLHPRLQRIGYPGWLGLAALAVLAACWSAEFGRESEVATMIMPSIATPWHLLAIDLSMLACMVALLSFGAALGRIPLLVALGRHSLAVYLVHPLIYRPVFAVLARVLGGLPFPARYATGCVASVAIVTALSLLAARLLEALPAARRFVMPRDWSDWLPVRLLR